MNATIRLGAAALVLLLAAPVRARDDRNLFPIADALANPAAKQKLDPGIKLFFGKQPDRPIAKDLGEFTANRKTNAFNKEDKEACEWVFLSAALALQERARKEGGDAVVGIISVYKGKETASETHYMCGNGAVIAGVAFRGRVVKLGGAQAAQIQP